MADSVEEFLKQAEYDKEDITNSVCSTSIEQLVDAVTKRQDCILFGPPGTSKTFLVNSLPHMLGENLGLIQKVQFHTNYSYEDFIEGIVPDVEKGGFKYETGVFYDFCIKANKNTFKDKLCLFVIDEINRANVTAVFGEVLYLMEEKGKRTPKTPKQKLNFTIPNNVVIIGTMNTADKTLAKLDFAFRRRFRFLAMYPSAKTLSVLITASSFNSDVGITAEDYIKCFKILNAKITRHPLLGKNLTLGHVLWTKKDEMNPMYSREDIGRIFKETILPQLESYCGSNHDVLHSLLGPKLRDKLIYGYEISDDEIIEYLSGLKNSELVNAK